MLPTINTTTFSTPEPANTTLLSTAQPEVNTTSGVIVTTPQTTTNPTFNASTYSTAEPVNTTLHSTDANITTSSVNSTAIAVTSATASPSAPLSSSTTAAAETRQMSTITTPVVTNSTLNHSTNATAMLTDVTNATMVTTRSTTATSVLTPLTTAAPTPAVTQSTSVAPSTAEFTPATPDANTTATTAPSSAATTTTAYAKTAATATPTSAVATTTPDAATAAPTSAATNGTSVAPSTKPQITAASSTISSTVHLSSTSSAPLHVTTAPATPSDSPTTIRRSVAPSTKPQTTAASSTISSTVHLSSTSAPLHVTTAPATPSDSPTTIRKTSPLTDTTTAPATTFLSTTVHKPTTPILTPSLATTVSTTNPTTTVRQTTVAKPTTAKPTDTPASTSAVPAFEVDISVELDKSFTPDLSDSSSDSYKTLTSQIESVLRVHYQGIKGFINVFVTTLREGSVIADFIIQTRQVNADEMEKVNEDLPEAMEPIAAVIGNISARYHSPTPIGIPSLTYTGSTMTLVCGPPPASVTMGQISGSTWQFKGRDIAGSGRFKISHDSRTSTLTISNVILADAGLYTCFLTGKALTFTQKGNANNIQPAPVVRLQSQINAKCEEGSAIPLVCCVQSNYRVKWFQGTNDIDFTEFTEGQSYCVRHDYVIAACGQPQTLSFTCRVDDPAGFKATTRLTIFLTTFTCDNDQFGSGQVNDIAEIGCAEGQEGRITAICQSNGEWRVLEDICIITEIKEILIDSEDVFAEDVPQLVSDLNQVVQKEQEEISNSSATVAAIVDILSNIAEASTSVNQTVMQGVLETVGVIVSDQAQESWEALNENNTLNASSQLLGTLETLADQLVGEFSISTQKIMLNRTLFNNSFFAELNSSITINIPDADIQNAFITTMIMPTFRNVMPVRNTSFDPSKNHSLPDTTVNAAVILVNLKEPITNVTLSYEKLNNSLSLNPQCVFWNFSTFNRLGSWDEEGCTFVSDVNNTVSCNCDHLTSFSILMSTDIPESIRELLDIITYIGVGISIGSLLICLIIEAYVWKAVTRNCTAFMRHVSIVNTALSLLMADICFIIGSAVAKNSLENPNENFEVPVGPCSTATFFMHFSYLALFFWMLVSGLLLFYRTVMVFSNMSKSTMVGIGFTFGYGCPLIIAVITVAVTASGNAYIRKESACWLNWTETKALLALVIPALTIVLINIVIVVVVLCKILRRGVGETAQADEKHTLVVIARCVIILTPLFGLTWSLGVGTMISPTNKGIHIAFAFFNSLQGFFILVFGTLLDSKIRSRLASPSGTDQARSTSRGTLSELFNRLRGRRYIYRVSEAANTTSNGATESFVNI